MVEEMRGLTGFQYLGVELKWRKLAEATGELPTTGPGEESGSLRGVRQGSAALEPSQERAASPGVAPQFQCVGPFADALMRQRAETRSQEESAGEEWGGGKRGSGASAKRAEASTGELAQPRPGG